jgi:hypothetical protein
LDPAASSGKGKGKGKEREEEEVLFGLVSVVPSTGDVLWDEFTDSHLRKELEVSFHRVLIVPQRRRILTSSDSVATDPDDAHPAARTAAAHCEAVESDREDARDVCRKEVRYTSYRLLFTPFGEAD